jgi:NTP pyrophosphatase (non-canonical NTP hydrolase)
MEFNEYQKRAEETAIYKPEYKVIYPVALLAEEAGEVSGEIAKMLRDNDGKMDSERRARLVKELGDALWAISAIASDLNVNLSTIAEMNIQKLEDRAKRGVIHGAGSDR